MMRTVNRLHGEGIRHFAKVHDSYGVHASDVDLAVTVTISALARLLGRGANVDRIDIERAHDAGARNRAVVPRPFPHVIPHGTEFVGQCGGCEDGSKPFSCVSSAAA